MTEANKKQCSRKLRVRRPSDEKQIQAVSQPWSGSDFEVSRTTPVDSEMSRTTPADSAVVQTTPNYFKVIQTTPADPEVSRTTPTDFKVIQTTPADPEVSRTTPANSALFQLIRTRHFPPDRGLSFAQQTPSLL